MMLEGPLFHKHNHHKVEVIVIIEARGPRNIQLVILIHLLQFNLVLSGSFCIIQQHLRLHIKIHPLELVLSVDHRLLD